MFDTLNIPDAETVTEGRRPFFEALILLRAGDHHAALKAFRRSARKADPPFDALSAIGAADCQFAIGKLGSALATLRKIVDDPTHSDGLLIGAWRKIATIEEARDNQTGVEEALTALDRLDDSLLH